MIFQKLAVGEKDQKRTDRKSTISQIIIPYKRDEQKSISKLTTAEEHIRFRLTLGF